MVDVDAPAGDGLTLPLRMHNLLLALAGRIDDSVEVQAHELVARADVDEAAELIAGTLIAGRIPVRAAERRELAIVLEMSRSDATLVDEVVVDELGPLGAHRFTGDNAPEYGVSQALERTVRVLPDVRAVHAVWRNTPAGAVPGPLPQRVVLVEVGPDGTPPAVAHRIEAALSKSGINAVVEVLNPWTDRSSYHEAALASARLCWANDLGSGPAPSAPESVTRTPPATHGAQSPLLQQQSGRHSDQPQAAPTEQARVSRARPEPPAQAPAPAQPPAEPPAQAAAPAQAADPEQPWHSARSWQLATEGQTERAEPAGFPDPVDLPEASEPTWNAAFQETEIASPGYPESPAAAEDPELAERESRAASTTEMTPAEMAQLRQALAEDPERGREIAATVRPGEVVEIPELDLNDPQLSDRDRELLRELHAELAARERAEAARFGVNGSPNA